MTVYNNLPEPSLEHKPAPSFLEKCLSNDYLEEMQTKSFANKLVINIFGPIMLRSRFVFKDDPLKAGDIADAFDFDELS